MKKTLAIAMALLLTVLLCSCCLKHEYAAATCTEPETCTKCGATEGEALGHSWADADCVTPKTCSACGETEGEALGHTASDWIGDKPDVVAGEARLHTECTVCGEKLEEKAEPLSTLIDGKLFLLSTYDFADRIRAISPETTNLELTYIMQCGSDSDAEVEIRDSEGNYLGWIWFYDENVETVSITSEEAIVSSLRCYIPFDATLDEDAVWDLFATMCDMLSRVADPTITADKSFKDAIYDNTFCYDYSDQAQALNGIYYTCSMGEDDSGLVLDVDIQAAIEGAGTAPAESEEAEKAA